MFNIDWWIDLNILGLYWERKGWRMGGREKESGEGFGGGGRVGGKEWMIIEYLVCFGSLLLL